MRGQIFYNAITKINNSLQNIKEKGVKGEKDLEDRTVGVEMMRKVGISMGKTGLTKTTKLIRQIVGR